MWVANSSSQYAQHKEHADLANGTVRKNLFYVAILSAKRSFDRSPNQAEADESQPDQKRTMEVYPDDKHQRHGQKS
jgi:hypothetical protein